ncbi:hypothetical protein BJ322DRAFT_1105794 [Thelephora terrestris]|uniref:HMG box domain-containing protein n=1 Tax=Thelephora terrestris TaxID=56493 RepID=A0A9P6L978_9AGAM|nr:hypothetical protein BJ322DRAFT_1105794 [Thelephora terrestris]
MPADRKSRPKRRQDDGFKQSHFDLKWTPPVEATLQTIEFTPNVTPTTFTDDSPPPLQPATAYIFPPEGEAFTNDNPKPRGRKGSGYIPRPPNAFILFRSSFIKSQHVTSDVETNHSTLSKIIGMTWQNLPNGERQAWHIKAKEAQEEHKRKWPQYSFRPVTNKAQKKKRRVRETEPKDIKRCEKIVELLCNGKKGDELKHAVKDFDKSHVPEFVARFEVPITERAYRRSSSAPLPDTDYEQSKQSFKPSALPQRKRSSSVEPEDLSSAVEIKLPTSGLAQFDSVPCFDSSPSTPGHSTPTPQRDGYIDFSNYSFGGPAIETYDSFSHSFASVTPSPPPNEFAGISQFVSPRKQSFTRLSITTAFLEHWINAQSSPASGMPESPAYYSSGASSPSEAITPFDDSFPQTHCGFEQQQSEESYAYGTQTAGYPYANMSSPVSPSPPSVYPYYSDVQQPLKDGFQYPSHMDYSVFMQPTYTA